MSMPDKSIIQNRPLLKLNWATGVKTGQYYPKGLWEHIVIWDPFVNRQPHVKSGLVESRMGAVA